MSVFIIAEAGVNHNGSLELAKKLVDVAADSGVDAVKFQTFQAKLLVGRTAEKAKYQKETTESSESQLEMIQKLELSYSDHLELLAHTQKKKIQFMSSPFDLPSLDFLANKIKVSHLKIGSGELTNAPLLFECGRSGLPVILSTGMSNLEEIDESLGVLALGYLSRFDKDLKPSVPAFKAAWQSEAGKKLVRENVTLLHCTTEYPTPFDSVNLKAMATLRDHFGGSVGFSDHTPGISASLGAVALGATVIEKHFTLDQNLPGPDHRASLSPLELKNLSRGVREVESSLGSSQKNATAIELGNRAVARKSLTAARNIIKGEVFSYENLTTKRPGGGLAPIQYWDFLGKKAAKDLSEDQILQRGDIE
jgi:N-acetylneuraminate synthase